MDQTGNWQVVDPLAEPTLREGVYPSLSQFLRDLTESRLIDAPELKRVLDDHGGLGDDGTPQLADSLRTRGLLNDFQLKRLLAGQTFGLVLGNYRVLQLLGSGGMGVVYKAEHIHMRRAVALKVLLVEDDDTVFLQRFNSEMEALAVLHHPNIVLAFDAGEAQAPGERGKRLRYLVMEYVPGQDLEQYVEEHGPLPIPLACDLIRQVANGLRHAHEHGLIHRDIKPSNLLVTTDPSVDRNSRSTIHDPRSTIVKILDFGLARLCRRRCTEAHSMLGTVDYMAPEQALDARSVDIRADIYGLGGTLYWLLTGQRPFPGDRPVVQALLARQHETPVPPRNLRGDIPLELEAIVCQMMARDPSDRYPTPLAVSVALSDFLDGSRPSTLHGLPAAARNSSTLHGTIGHATMLAPTAPSELLAASHAHRLLVVSPRPACRAACQSVLENSGWTCAEAAAPAEVWTALGEAPMDVVLIDSRQIDGGAVELCRRLRAEPPAAHLKLIWLAGGGADEPLAEEVESLCDDVVSWPAAAPRLLARVRLLLRLKEAEERAERQAGHLLTTNAQLEQALLHRDTTAHQAQDVLIFAVAKMAELRGQETGAHLLRMQQYSRVLAEEAMRLPAFAGRIDDSFVRMLERCVLLHDIGKVAIPDHILLKPGKLDAEERSIMESHTVLGANLLEAVARQHGACLAFLDMAIDVVRHHHERYDGKGYPDGLKGDAVPLAARIVALADCYDAMRSKLVYKPSLTHAATSRLLLTPEQGQFDPALLVAFRHGEDALKQIFEQTTD